MSRTAAELQAAQRCVGEIDGKQCRRKARREGALETRLEGWVGQRLYCQRCLDAAFPSRTIRASEDRTQ